MLATQVGTSAAHHTLALVAAELGGSAGQMADVLAVRCGRDSAALA